MSNTEFLIEFIEINRSLHCVLRVKHQDYSNKKNKLIVSWSKNIISLPYSNKTHQDTRAVVKRITSLTLYCLKSFFVVIRDTA